MIKAPFVVGRRENRTYVRYYWEDNIKRAGFQPVKSGKEAVFFCRKRQPESSKLKAESSKLKAGRLWLVACMVRRARLRTLLAAWGRGLHLMAITSSGEMPLAVATRKMTEDRGRMTEDRGFSNAPSQTIGDVWISLRCFEALQLKERRWGRRLGAEYERGIK